MARCLLVALVCSAAPAAGAKGFVNFETPHVVAGAEASWIYRAVDGTYRPSSGNKLSPSELTARAAAGSELTFTVVPAGSADLIAGKLLGKRRQRVDSGARRPRDKGPTGAARPESSIDKKTESRGSPWGPAAWKSSATAEVVRVPS